jgi:hypothetical protein
MKVWIAAKDDVKYSYQEKAEANGVEVFERCREQNANICSKREKISNCSEARKTPKRAIQQEI